MKDMLRMNTVMHISSCVLHGNKMSIMRGWIITTYLEGQSQAPLPGRNNGGEDSMQMALSRPSLFHCRGPIRHWCQDLCNPSLHIQNKI